MELCPTSGTPRDYFTKALQGSQFLPFSDIIIGIHEDDTPSYNAPIRALLEELNNKLEIEKEDSHKASKLAGN